MPVVRNGGAGGGSSLSNGAVVQFSGVRPSPLPALNSRVVLLEGGAGPTTTPLASTLTDNFDDNSQDTAKWNLGPLKYSTAVTTGTTIVEQNQRLEITPPLSAGSAIYSGYISVDNFDITGNSAFVQVSSAAAIPSNQECYLSFGVPGTVYLCLYSGGNIYLQKYVADALTNVANFAYSATTHKWWRLRESGGTIFLDTAADTASDPPAPGDWTNRLSETFDPLISKTGKIGLGAGAFTTITSATTIYFDGFNTATTAAVSNNIVGSTSLSFAPSATLAGTGALGGSSALTLTPSAALAGQGAVSGSSSVTLAPSGTVTGKGVVTGSSSVVLAPSAALAGSGAVVGSAALALAGSGTVSGVGFLAGSSTVALAGSGTVLGRGALTGITALTFVLAGNTGGATQISGSGSFGLVSAGVLTGRGLVSGNSSISLLLSGNLGSLAPSIWTVHPPTAGTWVNDNGPPFDGGEFDPDLFDADAAWVPQSATGSWAAIGHQEAGGIFDEALFDETMFDASTGDTWTVLTPSTGTWG